jgi:HNH endonuclease
MTDDQKFEHYTVKTDDCWLWGGSISQFGYGRFFPARNGGNTKFFFTHRWAYERFVGPIGDLCVLHRCDVRNCVRPDHLFLGTRPDNSLDMRLKGRAPNRRLTDEQVLEIRDRYGVESLNQLARSFGVSKKAILNIVHRYTYQHL